MSKADADGIIPDFDGVGNHLRAAMVTARCAGHEKWLARGHPLPKVAGESLHLPAQDFVRCHQFMV